MFFPEDSNVVLTGSVRSLLSGFMKTLRSSHLTLQLFSDGHDHCHGRKE